MAKSVLAGDFPVAVQPIQRLLEGLAAGSEALFHRLEIVDQPVIVRAHRHAARRQFTLQRHARTTTQNLTVHAVDVERGLLLIKGAVPGPPRGVVLVRNAVKNSLGKGGVAK